MHFLVYKHTPFQCVIYIFIQFMEFCNFHFSYMYKVKVVSMSEFFTMKEGIQCLWRQRSIVFNPGTR